ncbi:cytochrome b [Thermoproteus tenax]|uniref:Cytochrome b related protein n=1 Tax=Thermoproteus tenax (strain ATCC 35583 / DSM 2078 / JCM 9277 / NBRC 100435 / Kra 1) TaxID=768679 RepID=G4RN51_THETK|nr:cytochrome bc complex cytochrome b subunit [Thermoproteus tenax]CCC80995.1 cytochrome b related protein [Thermoproteus tenax Kra 1]
MSQRRGLIERISDWIADVFHLRDVPFMGVPDYMFSIEYWLGAIATSALIWQAITGLLLMLYYEPASAYQSTMYILGNIPFGKILLPSHLYGAYIMIFAVYIHGLYEFFRGNYKRPRGAQWVLGVLLFAITLGTAFLGYSLTGDVLSVDAVDVGKAVVSSIGLSGLIPVIFGAGGSAATYLRFLGWHIILAAAIILFFVLHFYLAEQNGFAPEPAEVGYKAPAVLQRNDPRIKPWWPRNFIFMTGIVFLTWGIILFVPSFLQLPGIVNATPVLFSPYPGPSPTSPQAAGFPAYPPWFFLFIYKMADMPFGLGTDIVMAVFIPLIILLLTPLIDRGDALHPLDRPWITALYLTGLAWVIELSLWGAIQPGVPVEPSWILITILPPPVIIFVGMYAAHLVWRRAKEAGALKLAPRVKGSGWPYKKAAEYFGYISGIFAVVLAALSFALNPATQAPYIGIAWGGALIDLSAALLSYFYVTYIE